MTSWGLFKRIRAEIRAVGLRDWMWFVLVLRRDEFSPKLSLNPYYDSKDKSWLSRLAADRNRAHHIDMVLSDIKYRNLQ